MKLYLGVFAVVLYQIVMKSPAFSQPGPAKDTFPSYKEIMPKFSEMTDHVSPLPAADMYRMPGGKVPASGQITADGSVKVNRTGEIIVPAETPHVMKVKIKLQNRDFRKSSMPQNKKRSQRVR